jgi:UDP-glucuronate 4-epimerase
MGCDPMAGTGKFLVTGGAGFIGSHVLEALLARGRSVAAVDNFDDFYSPALKRRNVEEVERRGPVQLFEADIRDQAALRKAFEAVKPEVVIHVAARAGVRPSIEQPELYAAVNVGGTVNLLTLARDFGVKKFLFISSSSVYGATTQVPFVEDRVEMRPVSPYAATKLAGELVCYTYSHLYQIPIVCLRLFTVFGPRQRPDLALHKFARLIEEGKPIPVFGDGSTSRDYTFVNDIVTGILAAVDFETPYDTFNLGNSHPVKLSEMVERLEKALGKKAEVNTLPPQAGDVPITWADISKARRLLGYEPKTSMDEGIERFVAWLRRGRG